ncbi:hypothetical protein CR513_33275, partial [Mucuna pruriens]
MSSIRQLLMKEAHEGDLMGHFRDLKTFDVLNEHFFWPYMRKDVQNVLIIVVDTISNHKISLKFCSVGINLGRTSQGHNPIMPNHLPRLSNFVQKRI